tara:strand:+ start:2290 stop:2637 length:348 start_codon:yes stop_codon:yes gene_type:complete
MKKSKLTLWIAVTIIAYFFCNGLLATEKSDTFLTVTQWCNTFEAVDKIIHDFERPTVEKLFEYGCHWVPVFMPVDSIIKEIVKEYYIFGNLWYMVKVELIGNFENPIGYTLIRGR